MIPHGIGIGPNPPQFVTNGGVFAPSWTVDPYTGTVESVVPQAQSVEWELERGGTPTVRLPLNPQSFPSVGAPAPTMVVPQQGSAARGPK